MSDGEAHAWRVLLSTAETHPTFRADVAVLFGKYLPRHGVHSDLVALHTQQPTPAWGGGACLTRPGPTRGARRHLLSVLGDLRLLWLPRRGYAAVVVRDKSVGALLGLVGARLAGLPFYYWMSFPMVEAWAVFARERGLQVGLLRWLVARARATVLRTLLYRVVLPGAEHVFVQSDRMLQEVAAKGVAAHRMTAVPMGVDTEAFAVPTVSDAADGAADDGAPLFVYLGTLSRLRNPDLMIRAMAVLRDQGVAARLSLIGDAEEAADQRWLRDLIAELQLNDRVQITGWLPVAEGLRRCAGAVAGLSPIPCTELLVVGSPTKVVEYFHLGLPVVANDQPDQAALILAVGGHCAPLSPEGFADAMRDVLARPAHHRAVAQAGQQLVRLTRSYDALARRVAGRLRHAA